MAKTRQIMSFCEYGKAYKVVRHYGTDNPYKIYHLYNDYNKYGYLTEHRKLMAQYADLQSCFYWFIQNNVGLSM